MNKTGARTGLSAGIYVSPANDLYTNYLLVQFTRTDPHGPVSVIGDEVFFSTTAPKGARCHDEMNQEVKACLPVWEQEAIKSKNKDS